MTKVTRKGKAGRSSGSKAAAPQVTAAQLFQQAQIALRFDDFDAAKDALRRAVRLEPHNGALHDAYACLLAELGDEAAREALLQAVAVAPTSGHEKYMYLAQLDDDPGAALKYSSQGLELLQGRLQAARAVSSPAREVKALSKALCGALCTHAEMMLSQACDAREEAAEAAAAGAAGAAGAAACPDPRSLSLDGGLVVQIQAALTQASQLEPESPEPGQALASLLSEQGRSEEALVALKASMALWWDEDGTSEDDDEEEGEEGQGQQGPGNSSMQEDDAEDEDQGAAAMDAEQAPQGKGSAAGQEADEEEEEEEEEEDDTPSFEFRFECAKLLLELDEGTDTAVGVLSALVEEHDSNPDAWHLLALALYSGHQYGEALEVAVKGQELLRKLRVPRKDDAWAQFADLMAAINEAQGAAAAAAGAAGIKTGF